MNRLYGFRTSETLSDPAICHAANRFAGKLFVRTGVFALLLSVVLLALLDEGLIKFPLATGMAVVLELGSLIVAPGALMAAFETAVIRDNR